MFGNLCGLKLDWRLFWIFLVAAVALDDAATAQVQRGSAPCDQIRTACRSAGFVEGGRREGNGLYIDCYNPIVRATPQPRESTIPLPQVDSRLVDACRAGASEGTPAPFNLPHRGSSTPTEGSLGAPPGGLVAVIAYDSGQTLDAPTFSNPYISGIAIQIHWSDIEPTEGTYNWSTLDAVVADAAANNKWVQFLIWPGFFTPSWELVGVAQDTFPIQYGPGKGTAEPLPMPWDSTYLSRWLAFVAQVGARYGANPTLKLVAAAGPTSVSSEATLPNSTADLKQWQTDGYTPTKYLNAWEQVLKAYAADFPNQFVSFSIGGGLDINDMGIVAKAQISRTRQNIVNQGVAAPSGCSRR
jgi:Beta-galactosidase